MDGKTKISNVQIKALMVTITIGVGILSLPSDIAMKMGNDGWLGILLGGLITIPFIIMIDRLFKLYPNKDFFQMGKEVVRPLGFKFVLLIFLIYNVLTISVSIRIFTDIMKTYLLETTPAEIIIITMLLATSYIARCQIQTIGRMAVIIYPIILGFIIFLLIISIPNMDLTNIYPILRLDYKSILRGISTAIFSYTGYEFILLVLPMAENREKALKYSLNGMLLVIGIYLIVFFVTLSQYGVHQLKREIWPTIALVKEVDLPGAFLENLDGIVLAAWVMVVYGTVGPLLNFSGIAIAEILNTKSHKIYILPLIPIIYTIAILPKSLVKTDEILWGILKYFSITATMIVPTILFLLGLFKSRRKNS